MIRRPALALNAEAIMGSLRLSARAVMRGIEQSLIAAPDPPKDESVDEIQLEVEPWPGRIIRSVELN